MAPRNLLITGATGTVSGALLDQLSGRGIRLRALVRDPAKAEPLQRRGVDAVVADLGDPRSLPAAFDGVDDLWLLTPNDPRSPEHSMNAIWAARQSGVERVVRLSAVGAAVDAPTRSGRLHALSDHELEVSGLRWTILRPHWFMQNLFNEAGDIAEHGVVRLNLADGRVGMIDARDIAECAAAVLLDETSRHDGRIYTPTGPRSLSLREVAEAAEGELRRPVRYEPVGDADVERRLSGFGVPDWTVGMVTEYARAYASGWGDFITGDVEEITGRPARGVERFIADHREAFVR
ncbi:uncharacterized protein YbjT (DUF2867 family) [Stackebrandtia endophytica]|uniref:Uncharacterized protein YbjT (DUF2867 family) n=1 Tax=Stackebrandtia endophytica TaxID=1496996 RepID=A0A543AQ35_9ACTN|nr:SDR family oxidoreductase [Stackebrandtia endophytica]TQL74635.1 uncharacterized protein YbjT (DUF2867 family) [Stackebrandtia endophytica]